MHPTTHFVLFAVHNFSPPLVFLAQGFDTSATGFGFAATYMTLFRTIHPTSTSCTYAVGTSVNHCALKRDGALRITSVNGVTLSDSGTGLFTSIIGGGWFVGDRVGAGPGNNQVSVNFNLTTGIYFNRPATQDSVSWGIYWRSKTYVARCAAAARESIDPLHGLCRLFLLLCRVLPWV
jgi:hypothetical protein